VLFILGFYGISAVLFRAPAVRRMTPLSVFIVGCWLEQPEFRNMQKQIQPQPLRLLGLEVLCTSLDN